MRMKRADKRTDGVGTAAVVAIRPILDYPRHNEKIKSKHYSFRIGVPGLVKIVEIAINRGPWQACRHSVGYWWYDWSGYKPGKYQAVIRAQTAEGERIFSEPRDFLIEI